MKNPKKKIEIIFYLIKRMSRTQKRHFKLSNQAYKGTDKDFMKLFDFINKLPSYDIEKIGRFFIEKKIKNKNLCIGYLLTKLVECIDDGTLNNIVGSKQQIIITRMKTLRTYIKMNLNDLAYKELLAIEQIAQQYSLYPFLHQIYEMWGGMIFSTYSGEQRREQRALLRSKYLKLLEESRVYEDAKYAMDIFMHAPTDSQQFEDTYQLLIPYKKYNFSPWGKIVYYHVLYWHSEKIGARKPASEYCWKVITTYHQYPDFISIDFGGYIINWNNFLLIVIQIEDNETIEKYLEEYRLLPQRFSKIFSTLEDTLKAAYELVGHRCEVAYVIDSEQYAHIEKVSKNTLKTLETYTTPININPASTIPAKGLFMNLIYGFILLGNMQEAQYWLDKISDLFKRIEHSPNIAILELIILYEEASFILLQSRIRSLKRKWKKEKHPEVVMLMLNLLDSLLKKQNQKKLPEIYKAAHQKVLKIEQGNSFYIFYSKWIAKKM